MNIKFTFIAIIIILVAALGYYYFSTPKIDPEGLTCGGVAGFKCPEHYVCYYPENKEQISDAVGQCIPEYVDYSITP